MSEEFIMDFKPEERTTQTIFSQVFELEDLDSNSSTITAPETGSRCNVSAPPLICKLRKCRVLIKRLPRHLLVKHSNISKTASSLNTPARSSKRLGGKILPGKYLALHANKPFSAANKHFRKTVYENTKRDVTNKTPPQRFHRKPDKLKFRGQEECFLNRPTVTKYSDVIITKYPMPTTRCNGPYQVSTPKTSLATQSSSHNWTSKTSYLPSNAKNTCGTVATATPVSLKSSVNNQCVVHNLNITDAATTPNSNDNRPRKLISTLPVDNATTALKKTSLQQSSSTTKPISKPAIVSHRNILQNDAVIVKSSKVLVINQPALKNDPLNSLTNTLTSTNSDIEEIAVAETETSQNRAEPEVIKRIIYHSKYAQTKFTCSGGNICGLVDTNGFNLNCFYCYDIFPLHKWQEFKNHIKCVHHVEEEEMESDDGTPPLSPIRTLTPTKERTKMQTTTKSLENALTKQNLNDHKSLLDDDDACNEDDDEDVKFKDLIQNLSDDEGDSSCEGENEKELVKTKTRTPLNISNLLSPKLRQHITIKTVKAENCKMEESSKQNVPEETFIKLPSNLNIQQVLKTIPKTTGQNDGTDGGSKKPRYFVVKKVINPVNSNGRNDLNASTANVVLKKVSPLRQYNNDDDDMPSNDENEDPIPRPTNGCGILFGLTNRTVVIEFLLKLKTFPELWRPQAQKSSSNIDYNESIMKICDHLNKRFLLDIKDFEIRLSIQRVKDWYCRMLRNIHEHNKTHKSNEPFPHKFPLYFKILNQFLTSELHSTNNHLLSSGVKAETALNNHPKWMVHKKDDNTDTTREEQYAEPLKLTGQTQQQANEVSTTSMQQPSTQSNTPPTTPPTTPPFPELDDNTVIEFDADTLYGNESSSEEILEEFDETKRDSNINAQFPKERKRTKVYLGHFACDICSKVFKRKCDLDRHKVHHFPPKYQCSVCSKKYFFQHWAERCSHIKKSTVEENNNENGNNELTEQEPIIRIKPKWPKKIFRFKLICETCGAAYRSIGSLNAHKRDKHLNQRLKCIVCNFTAITNYRIIQHQKKRHIVEPGTVEEVAKKSRARTDTKTPFSVEARQEFDWRREMRKKLKPGEKFYGCCKCRIIFETRKEKVLHNKTEHPIKETTVVCLLCLPEKMLLSNSNSVRRHYTDIHKVPWDEIDALVKRTKPVYNFLSKEQIEVINASENYIELVKEMLKDVNLEEVKQEHVTKEEADEATEALLQLTRDAAYGGDLNGMEFSKMEVDEGSTEENVFIDGIIDHDYNNDCSEEDYNEHNYSEELANNESNIEYYIEQEEVNDDNVQIHEDHQQQCIHQQQDINVDVDDDEGECVVDGVITPMAYHIECQNVEEVQVEQKYIDNFVEGQLVEECIVVEEECFDDVINEDEYY